MNRIELAYVVAALAVTALAVIALGLWWARVQRSRRARRRGARAVRGERAAEGLLAAAGYQIVGRQVSLDWTIEVGGETVTIALRADFVVRDGDRLLIAEVKTGDAAPLITHPATRRQLLEYLVAYQADGVLLVDVEVDVIAEVEFFIDRAQMTKGPPAGDPLEVHADRASL